MSNGAPTGASVDLLDASVLIPLVVGDHVHHPAVVRWSSGRGSFATCPSTQGSLLRFLVRTGGSGTGAQGVLAGVLRNPRHRFWPDQLGYDEVDLGSVLGHRQVTDAYLAGLARAHGGRLATFDRGIAALHPDVAELVPVDTR